jgi:ABC-type oligopeptide transport system substrate-binding subunit
MLKIGLALGATTLLLAACGQPETTTTTGETDGPIVAAPESPMNPAVNTDGTQTGGPTPGASSFTSVQAREAIEKAGYTDVGELSQDAQGVWSAPAMREGAQATVSVDYKGEVTAR